MLSAWTTEWRGMRHVWPGVLGVIPFSQHVPCGRPAKRLDREYGLLLECVGCKAQQGVVPDGVHLLKDKEFYVWCGVMRMVPTRSGFGVRYVWAHDGSPV